MRKPGVLDFRRDAAVRCYAQFSDRTLKDGIMRELYNCQQLKAEVCDKKIIPDHPLCLFAKLSLSRSHQPELFFCQVQVQVHFPPFPTNSKSKKVKKSGMCIQGLAL